MPADPLSRLGRFPKDLARIALALVVTIGLVGLLVGATVLFRKDLIHEPSDEAETAESPSAFVVVTERAKEAPRYLGFDGPEGALDDLTVAELTALCWAHNRYREHSSLDANVGMLSDPGLLRSAELLDGDYEGDEVALRAEAVGSNLGSWRQGRVLSELRGDPTVDEEELARASAYLAARSQPPSGRAQENYVVFEVGYTLDVALIVRMRVGSVVNDQLPQRRNTAIYAHVESPDRDQALRVHRPEIERSCERVRDR